MSGTQRTRASARAFVGLGANLGNARETVLEAVRALGRLERTRVAAVSSLYASAPVDATGPDFVNAVAELRTELEPHELLDALLSLEREHGRARGERNAPRTLDLDLLLYDERVIRDATLTVPHPRMHERAFVLLPLSEIDPTVQIPGGAAIRSLLARCAGQRVQRIAQDTP